MRPEITRALLDHHDGAAAIQRAINAIVLVPELRPAALMAAEAYRRATNRWTAIADHLVTEGTQRCNS